jgi:hypothetical protein
MYLKFAGRTVMPTYSSRICLYKFAGVSEPPLFSGGESYKTATVVGFVYLKLAQGTALPLFSGGESCTLLTVAGFVYLKFAEGSHHTPLLHQALFT